VSCNACDSRPQVHSNLFGVVYVLDEPSAGLHPADTEALLAALDQLKASGNSLFVVEHELDVIRHADWIVDVGPVAGEQGGEILYSGPTAGLERVKESQTRRHLFGEVTLPFREPRTPKGVVETKRRHAAVVNTANTAWGSLLMSNTCTARLVYCVKSDWATSVWASPLWNSPAARRSESSSRPSYNEYNVATLFIFSMPTTGLHPADVEKLMVQLDGLWSRETL
jgi:excinuclease UvrABC ATPase subunit